MVQLLNQLNSQAEGYKGRNLVKLLIYIFLGFLIVGLLVGYLAGFFINEKVSDSVSEVPQIIGEQMYEGTITFLEPSLYPEDRITHVLVDSSGKDIILLRANDQILEVSEGHFAKVYGIERTTSRNEKVLLVDRVSIRNGTN